MRAAALGHRVGDRADGAADRGAELGVIDPATLLLGLDLLAELQPRGHRCGSNLAI
jgi:hypothetical protein